MSDYNTLSSSDSWKDHFCFPLPPNLRIKSVIRGNNSSLATNEMTQKTVFEILHSHYIEDSLHHLSSSEREALSTIIPYLLCGEESSAIAFFLEANWLCDKNKKVIIGSLQKVALEEAQHEFMLRYLSSLLPVPKNVNFIKEQTQRFFKATVKGCDSATHFGKISGLDTQVCKIMNALTSRSSVIAKSPLCLDIASKIHKDETTHVRICRKYAMELGVSTKKMSELSREIAEKLIDLLRPAGQALETLKVDTDLLFAKISGQNSNE